MKKFLLLLFYFLSCSAVSLIAQQSITVTGTVTDEKGLPLESVAVKPVNAKGGTLTDSKGQFVLLLKDASQTLEFSYIGFATMRQKIGGSTTLTIVLKEDKNASSLQDVVVVGQQTQSKRKTTTAISSVMGKRHTKPALTQRRSIIAGKGSRFKCTDWNRRTRRSTYHCSKRQQPGKY